MEHPYKNKLFFFIGNPSRCTRHEAWEALFSVGGVLDDRMSDYTHYVVAFKADESNKTYQKAFHLDDRGLLRLINERQFFEILNEKIMPPALKKPTYIGSYIPYREERRYNIDFHYKEEEFVIKKRNINLEKYDIYSANIGSYITCIQHLRKLKQVIDYLRQNYLFDYHSKNYAKTCKRCGRYSMFHLRDEDSGFYAPLCKFCYNVMMAKVLAIPVPHKIPNTITVKDFNEISIEFEINLIIFETGISLSALHYGSRKRKIEVFGELETDYIKLLESLKQKVKKRTSTRYIDSSGHFTGDYAIGHIEFDGENNEHIVIINNVPYSWDNLKCNLSSYEGWDIKIEFGEPGDDLD